MEVKGTAFIVRAQHITKAFGREAWDSFLAEYAKKDPFFAKTIVATSMLPVEKIIALNDAVTERFFGGDNRAYWKMGEEGARWALTEGPYAIFAKKSLQGFVERSMPKLWSTYFHGGKVGTSFDGSVLDVTIEELPLAHVYFEYLVMGYVMKSLELFEVKNLKMEMLSGWDSPGGKIHYRFSFEA